MSVVVVERPCFWKAWWLHCLVRAHAPQAATRKGLKLEGRGISKVLLTREVLASMAASDTRGRKPPKALISFLFLP